MSDASRVIRELLLLAPTPELVPACFTRLECDRASHFDYLAGLQRLRGSIYLEDGAIEPWQLTEDGRHDLPLDHTSWHILTVEGGRVMGCARMQFYEPTVSFHDLGVSRSAQAQSPRWGSVLSAAITDDLRRAKEDGFRFVEAGGWALAPELRATTEALQIALSSYALAELVGGCVGLSTATVRHNSSSILRRLGGTPYVWDGQSLPAYYDPVYRCEMEVVRFDCRVVNPRFRPWVSELASRLPSVRTVCATNSHAPAFSMALADAIDEHDRESRLPRVSALVSRTLQA